MKLNKLILLAFVLTGSLLAQGKITLPEAMAMALENNYDIRIAKNNLINSEKSAKVTMYNTFTPTVSLGANSTIVNNSQEIFNSQISLGIEDTKDTYFGGNMGIGLRINDIYQAIQSYKKAYVDHDGQIEGTEVRIHNLMKEVMSNYFNLAKQQNLLKVQEEAVKTSQQQVERAESRYQIGSAAKKDVMSQKVQLNTDRSSLLRQKLAVQTAQNQLNISLGRNPFDPITVEESVSYSASINSYEELEGQLLSNNPDLRSSKKSLESAEIAKQQANYSLYFPSLGVFANYNRNVSNDTDLGNTFDRLTDFKTNFSSNIGVSLNYSFNIGTAIQSQQAEISRQNADLELLKKEKELKATLYQAYITYKNAIEQVTLLEENVEASRENLKLAQERFNLGSGTSIDLRQAQDGLTSAETNLVNARFDAKLSEVEIERLLGTIETN
jgi:outer membrane protein TolC